MAVTYSQDVLSGSTHGTGIKVGDTATPGTLIHTATTSATDLDEVYLWAFNSHTADVLLTVEFGGVTDPDNIIEVTIPKQAGLVQVCPGLPLRNTLIVRAFADTINVITIYGHYHRKTTT